MKAINEIPEGILVNIEVSPKSKKFEIAGYNEWRERVEIRLKSPPLKGRANKEIINEFSKLTKSDVEIISGLKSHYKTLKIYNMSKLKFLDIINIS